MTTRREPRKDIKVPVRIFGTDAEGRVFSENVFSINVSRCGAKLTGVHSQIRAGEVIGMAYGPNKGRFTVKWVGRPGSDRDSQIGLEGAASDRTIWDFPVPGPENDPFKRNSKQGERRKHPRMKCANSVEILPVGESSKIWGNAVELGMGGCFVEMHIPLKEGTRLKIGVWIKEEKVWASAKVVNSRPGFGIGIEFMEMSDADASKLRQFLVSITRMKV